MGNHTCSTPIQHIYIYIMVILATAEFEVYPEKLADFLPWLHEALKDTRKFNGCLSVESHVEQGTQHGTANVFLVEKWVSVEANDAYYKWRGETGLMGAL